MGGDDRGALQDRATVLRLCVDMAGVLFFGTFAAQSSTAFAFQCLGLSLFFSKYHHLPFNLSAICGIRFLFLTFLLSCLLFSLFI